MAVTLTTPKAPNGAFRSRTPWEQAKVDRFRARQAVQAAKAAQHQANLARMAQVASAAAHGRTA